MEQTDLHVNNNHVFSAPPSLAKARMFGVVQASVWALIALFIVLHCVLHTPVCTHYNRHAA